MQFATAVFADALTRAPDGVVRPAFVGPPNEALSELYKLLVPTGKSEWSITVSGVTYPIVVFLVDGGFGPSSGHLSGSCSWDYAVSVRNSCPRVLMLVHRALWD